MSKEMPYDLQVRLLEGHELGGRELFSTSMAIQGPLDIGAIERVAQNTIRLYEDPTNRELSRLGRATIVLGTTRTSKEIDSRELCAVSNLPQYLGLVGTVIFECGDNVAYHL